MKPITVAIVATISIIVIAAMVPVIQESAESPETLDVFIVAGQSNTYATIAIDSATVSEIPEAGTGYYFGTSTAPTYNKTMDLDSCSMQDLNNSGSAAIGGIYAPFAKEYVEKTGHDVYLIDTGLSGQTIGTFIPGGGNYDYVSDVIEAGIKAIPSNYNVNFKGYIWIQGEGDAGTNIPTYEARMFMVYNSYDSGYIVSFPTCYICKVRSEVSSNASIAQSYLCNTYDQFIMASELADTFTVENGLMYSDNLHYSQAGCNALGTALGETIGEMNTDHSGNSLGLIMIIPVFMVLAVFAFVARSAMSKKE